jgi:hypothetical protein
MFDANGWINSKVPMQGFLQRKADCLLEKVSYFLKVE